MPEQSYSGSYKKKIYARLYKLLQRGGMTHLLAHYHLGRRGYLAEYGWFDAFAKGMPMSKNGEPLPWLVYPVIDLLQERLQPDFAVFEYGSGASSRWWASRVRQITSVEHDPVWYSEGVRKAPQNLRLLLREGDAYPRAIAEENSKYHIVIVDGRRRAECAVHGAEYLRDDGVLIWDNSERERYQSTQAALRDRGFKHLRMRGIAPSSFELQETSILYRANNCLGL